MSPVRRSPPISVTYAVNYSAHTTSWATSTPAMSTLNPMIDIKEQQHNIKLLYGWSDEELLKRLGPGPYVMYGGGPDPPPPGLTIGGMPILHDPSMEFNCTRVAADTRGNDEHS